MFFFRLPIEDIRKYENQIKAGVVKADPARTQLTVRVLNEWLAKAGRQIPGSTRPTGYVTSLIYLLCR